MAGTRGVSPAGGSSGYVLPSLHIPSEEVISSIVTDVCRVDDSGCSLDGSRTKRLSRRALLRDCHEERNVACSPQTIRSERNNTCTVLQSSGLCRDWRCPQPLGKQKTKMGAEEVKVQPKGKRKVVDLFERSSSSKLDIGNQDCDSNSLQKSTIGNKRGHKNKRVRCPITEELIQNRVLRVGDRVEYRSDNDECLAQGWIRASGIVCGKCGQHVTCSDFGCCAGKHRGAAGEHIYFPSGKKLTDILQQFLTQQCSLSAQLSPSDSAKESQENSDSHQDGHADYDKTIDLLFGHI